MMKCQLVAAINFVLNYCNELHCNSNAVLKYSCEIFDEVETVESYPVLYSIRIL